MVMSDGLSENVSRVTGGHHFVPHRCLDKEIMATGHITPAELAIMKELWQHGPSMVRELAQWLYDNDEPAKLASIQKLLDRLLGKKFAKRSREGKAYRFSAAISESELMARQVSELADQLSQGSLVPVLTHLVKTRKLSADEVRELQKIVKSAKT